MFLLALVEKVPLFCRSLLLRLFAQIRAFALFEFLLLTLYVALSGLTISMLFVQSRNRCRLVFTILTILSALCLAMHCCSKRIQGKALW